MLTFIEQIAPLIQRYAPKYGICVVSPIIAQAILESKYGTSELAVNAKNFFGIKHRHGRCPSSVGIYAKSGAEQNPDGTYTNSAMEWCIFRDMEGCVKGYFEFIGIDRYANLKGITDPEQYLKTIKADGYATSQRYVENLMSLIREYDLTQFDEVKEMAKTRTVSPLAQTLVSFGARCSNPRLNEISVITPHHMAGVMTAEACAKYHLEKGVSSANYYIGNDGDICAGVMEDRRAWTSGTGNEKGTNDHKAITIEVSNSKNGNEDPRWPISDKAYASLVALCADICSFYGINPHFDGTVNGTITIHKMFQATACPGPYLEGIIRSGQLERDILASMGKPQPATLWRVQTGAYKVKENAVRQLESLRKIGEDGIIVRYGDLYKVQVGAFAEKKNADRKAIHLQACGFKTYITEKGGDMVAV